MSFLDNPARGGGGGGGGGISGDDDRFGVSAEEALARLEAAFALAIAIAAELLIIQTIGNSILSVLRAAPRNN